MSYSADEITYFIGPALDRIAAKQVTFATQTTAEALAVLRHYEQTRDSLLRSYEWPFATDRETLVQIQTLTLDDSPAAAAFAAGATITGVTSGTTCTVLEAVSTKVYTIAYLDGDFTDSETLGDGTNTLDCADDYPTVAVTTPTFKWTYQYELPTDYLRLISVYEDDGSDLPAYRWTLEGNRILTDYSTMNIKYVKKITDPTLFEDLFTEVLILRLAQKLINSLAGSASQRFKDELREELKTAEARARVVSAQENNTSGYDSFNQARNGA